MKQKEKALVKKKSGVGRVSPRADGPRPWMGLPAPGAKHGVARYPFVLLCNGKKERTEEGGEECSPTEKSVDSDEWRPRLETVMVGDGLADDGELI